MTEKEANVYGLKVKQRIIAALYQEGFNNLSDYIDSLNKAVTDKGEKVKELTLVNQKQLDKIDELQIALKRKRHSHRSDRGIRRR